MRREFPSSAAIPAIRCGLHGKRQAWKPGSISCRRAAWSSGNQLRIWLAGGRHCLAFWYLTHLKIRILRQRQAQIASIKVEHQIFADKIVESVFNPRVVSKTCSD